ncbi:hypothetical protein L3Q82_025667 [Scortum barcoo]|uniref:Uncharacterized protein n=1 Tax=Scortum barcoo TaxID=214431 RepID=A0ACB8WLN0_9TELE|nr:hypothetical protein L3Q82_025667 [Scortum barcoo]
MSLSWPGNASGSPLEELEEVSGLPATAATQPVINASPYSPAIPLGTVYQPPSNVSTRPIYQSPSLQPSQHLQLYQPLSVPSTQPAYQLVPAPPDFTLQQPTSALQVQYSPQSQYTPLQVPYTVQSPRQPVPVPELPKLVHDSEREFADLKMALDHLLNPHTELSEHYKYRVLMEHLVLDEAKLIAQVEDVLQSIKQSFYVENCLQSLSTAESAKLLVDKMRQCLASGRFEI